MIEAFEEQKPMTELLWLVHYYNRRGSHDEAKDIMICLNDHRSSMLVDTFEDKYDKRRSFSRASRPTSVFRSISKQRWI